MNRADLRIVRSVQTPQLEVATPIEGGSLYSWPCLACKAHNWFKWEWRGGSGIRACWKCGAHSELAA